MSFYLGTDYVSTGGNRHSAAADWSRRSNLLAFGSDQNVALWYPLNESRQGIFAILPGHTHKINAVKFLFSTDEKEVLITGSADGEIRLWIEIQEGQLWTCKTTVQAHDGAINAIAVSPRDGIFATGGSETKIKLWKFDDENATQLCELVPKPKLIPLTLVLGSLSDKGNGDALFLTVAGTRNDIQVFSIQNSSTQPTTNLCATLTGHEGWIRSLALIETGDGNFLLASASQDKYIRLWRFQRDESTIKSHLKTSESTAIYESGLTAKVNSVSVPGVKYFIHFEALLLGHEDWIYSANWSSTAGSLQLLTASADGSLAIWEPDPTSGIWVSTSRLGEISVLKGATTATGSAGGFWIGLWSPNGRVITCLGRSGGWRSWQYIEDSDYWAQQPGVSGHVGPVNGLTWNSGGDYLLSTSSDQTTRLHAEWKRGERTTWHEFSRPQIHGYDLNCIACTKSYQFCSGADEKLLRVFDTPKAIAETLKSLCQIELPTTEPLPDTAAMPALGLSNKSLDDIANEKEGYSDDFRLNGVKYSPAPPTDLIQEPPNEDVLARHTLWPEREKLYGHGHEISELAVSPDGQFLATACKASSIDHAVIRLYDTKDWHEIKPSLSAHSLTVTRLAWYDGPKPLLLSVGRDRQWSLFHRNENENGTWELLQSNAKAHSRMILDAAWSHAKENPFFVTAGRDKTVKIWYSEEQNGLLQFNLANTITRKAAVTSVALCHVPQQSLTCIAVGEENGSISFHILETFSRPTPIKSFDLASEFCPSRTVNRLVWRPDTLECSRATVGQQLAIAGADSSVKIIRIDLERLASQ